MKTGDNKILYGWYIFVSSKIINEDSISSTINHKYWTLVQMFETFQRWCLKDKLGAIAVLHQEKVSYLLKYWINEIRKKNV